MTAELKTKVEFEHQPRRTTNTRKVRVKIPHITESNSSRRLREKNERIASTVRKIYKPIEF